MKARTKSCRFSGGTAERIEKAASSQEVLQSEIFRRAVRHYIESNPDEIPVFSELNDGVNVAEIESESSMTEKSDTVGLEGDEGSTSSEDESVSLGGVYDPSREDV